MTRKEHSDSATDMHILIPNLARERRVSSCDAPAHQPISADHCEDSGYGKGLERAGGEETRQKEQSPKPVEGTNDHDKAVWTQPRAACLSRSQPREAFQGQTVPRKNAS